MSLEFRYQIVKDPVHRNFALGLLDALKNNFGCAPFTNFTPDCAYYSQFGPSGTAKKFIVHITDSQGTQHQIESDFVAVDGPTVSGLEAWLDVIGSLIAPISGTLTDVGIYEVDATGTVVAALVTESGLNVAVNVLDIIEAKFRFLVFGIYG